MGLIPLNEKMRSFGYGTVATIAGQRKISNYVRRQATRAESCESAGVE
jgi:hypothetical protein